MGNKDKEPHTFGPDTDFKGLLKFKETLCIKGKFTGTIEAAGMLIVDEGAVVEADRISVTSLEVMGTVTAPIYAQDMVDMKTNAVVRGDITAARLRIADKVTFEGQCAMTGTDKDVEIFSRPIEEIKAELQRTHDPSGNTD
ncbi:MAG: polymer-forming cytoskeletal protein [Spirochaetaceae bacterium]|jgi:cytoskeletal protein CcmA (bactofilin family)|nr:polymer-forming cytoskeletal protein [Spirochaetaceae bacterium]